MSGRLTPVTSDKKNTGSSPASRGDGANNAGTKNVGGSGSGSSGGAGSEDKKAQDNLKGISGYNFQTPKLTVDLTDEALDKADKGNKNIRDFALADAGRKSTAEWYKSQQDLQSVVSQLADASGNLMNGSGFLDFQDLIARRDDQQDVEILNTAHENENAILKDYYEALQQNINSRNQMYIDAQEAMRGVAADYVAQSNNIDADLATKMVDKNNKTLKLPDWLKSDNFAKNRFRDEVNPKIGSFYRPTMSAQKATNNGLVDREPTTVNQPSTNQSYWERMRSGYGRRTQ